MQSAFRAIWRSRSTFGHAAVKGTGTAAYPLPFDLASSIGRGYKTLQESDYANFASIVGSSACLRNDEALLPHNLDWMNRYQGRSKLALQPDTVEQVSELLSYCNDNRIAVVPQAGNSGLCGGSVPVSDEVILLTHKLNKVIKFDEVSGLLTCQAGCTLGMLQEHVGARGFVIPLDLGAKQCQAGGFVSTNAGGLRFLRYGSLRGSVLGIEAVLADGRILDLLEPLRKNNTGYDMKQLFIGGEGTLGLVTGVSIACPPKASSVNLVYMACRSYANVQQVLIKARHYLGEILSAFEFIDEAALQITLDQIEDVKDPLPNHQTPFYVLIETSGSDVDHDSAKLKTFLNSARAADLIADGTIAQNSKQIKEMWQLRERISVALSKKGPVYKYDLSLPLSDLYNIVEEIRQRLKPHKEASVVAYGHLGDGNLHLNVSVPEYNKEVLACIEPYVYEFTALHKGSISAEHGLGQMKNNQIFYSKDNLAVEMMWSLKRMFDPHLILNPYKYFPSNYWPS